MYTDIKILQYIEIVEFLLVKKPRVGEKSFAEKPGLRSSQNILRVLIALETGGAISLSSVRCTCLSLASYQWVWREARWLPEKLRRQFGNAYMSRPSGSTVIQFEFFREEKIDCGVVYTHRAGWLGWISPSPFFNNKNKK